MKKILFLIIMALFPLRGFAVGPQPTELPKVDNDFSFRFLQQIESNEKGDWFVSPLSLQFLLDMILNGSGGATTEEIARVLNCNPKDIASTNDLSRLLLEQFPKLDPATKLTIGNAIFINKKYPVNRDFQRTVEKYYNAEVENLDFNNENSTLKTINGWCNKQTKGLIPSVLNSVNPDMFAYLLNALYFKGAWTYPFNKKWTQERSFHLESGQEKQVWMMEKERKYSYGENDLFQRIRLPYGDGAYAMYVLLPKKGHTVAEVVAALDAASWQELRSHMYSDTKINLWLPRFETKYHIKLNDILKDMGMPGAFRSGADFKAMSRNADFLDFVQQDAIIKVDEEGSEAAAVTTAGMMGATAIPEPPRVIDFHCDHPFLYLITEAHTGAILFAGKYTGK